MDFINNLTKSTENKAAEAKVAVAKAQEPEKSTGPGMFETAKGTVAGATADAIGGASNFAKLDKTQGVGKQATDAEVYLRDVNTAAQKTHK